MRYLAEMTAEVLGYDGKPVFDATKPDGTMRKVLDVSRIRGLGWHPMISLAEGIKLTYGDFVARCP